MKQYMAIDQYGRTEHGLTHPRSDLMNRCGVKHDPRINDLECYDRTATAANDYLKTTATA
jgi:hypothetical protein